MKSEKQLIMLGAWIGSGVTLLLVVLFIWGIGTFFKARGENWLIGSGVAVHMDGKEHCNSLTTGLGLEHRLSENWRITEGFYRNSQCKWSLYGAGVYTPWHRGNVHAGIALAGVTGYNHLPIAPAAGFALAVEGKRDGVNLTYIPKVKETGNVLWINLKWRLD